MVHTRLMWYCGGGQRMNSRKADRRRGRGGQVAWLFTPWLTDLDNGATASDSDSVSLSVCSFLSLSLFLSSSLSHFISSSLLLFLSSSLLLFLSSSLLLFLSSSLPLFFSSSLPLFLSSSLPLFLSSSHPLSLCLLIESLAVAPKMHHLSAAAHPPLTSRLLFFQTSGFKKSTAYWAV